ncbi:MAG: penicillin-insensitive murein endopeptidase [Beijerinckiaceae bacterium]|nr:penicillin-insensitive murein endopeptidase [Beijerinckiaceae bacterium]
MTTRSRLFLALWAAAVFTALAASAQERGTLDPKPLPPLRDPRDPRLPAKQVFGRETAPAALPVHVYGFYSKGCIAGARALPLDGPDWQVMRPSRNRFWGHPALIAFLERYAARVRQTTRWPGILIGDMAQPRGGPMFNGHASHQIGLDADVWLRPMLDRRLNREEREEMPSLMMVREDRLDVDPRVWTPDTMGAIEAAARDRQVERIFVNAAIKRAICRDAKGDRSWLAKVRPMWGHDYHFHIRLACPANETTCEEQDPIPGTGDGCDASLAHWFSDGILHPRPSPHPPRPKPPITMAAMPAECRMVAAAPNQR